VNNIGELVEDDRWVSGQLARVAEVINHPLTQERIGLAERSFKEVIHKQSMLKHGLREAKSTFKRLIGVFVERLSEMSTSASGYHERIEGYASRLEQADELSDLQNIVADLVSDTRSMQVDMMRARDEILEARKQAEHAEERVRQLEAELETVSEQVREDQLTGTLNRRGLEDAMQREIARAQRKHTPLTIAILDLDNFKKLNDTYGHQAGDDALVHLANVVRKTLRPTDTVARFGGEEFVIVLAETELNAAVEVMRRLQRELTRRFFLHGNERLLITFSAGVAQLNANETPDAVIARADKAMYQAKLQGKNRVVMAQ
jgi:diguanylate cyclase